jgi:gliding motility-associated transport system ATP-binding protein
VRRYGRASAFLVFSRFVMIEFRGVSKRYGPVRALTDVSFSLNTGCVTGLLGPNGAGKSTTIRILVGYLDPDEGTVLLDGAPYGVDSSETRARIGYLPENAPAYDEMLVTDFLAFESRLRGVDPDEALPRTIADCSLGSMADRPIRTLSKGYRQRVGLARALLAQSDVIVLDEPTNGLDPNQTGEVRSLIRRIAETRTVLLSTHLLHEVELLCDRVLILDHGRLRYDDILPAGDRSSVESLFRQITIGEQGNGPE